MAWCKKNEAWSDGIVYYRMDDSVSHIEGLIESAMQHIRDRTEEAVEFEEVFPGTSMRRGDFVQITRGNGCYLMRGKKEVISIGPGCENRGTIVHELMHALGFEHEHNAYDRNAYVTILWDNIEEGQQSQYKKLEKDEFDDLGMDFDIHSIMMYGGYDFSRNGEATMEAKKGNLPENRRQKLSKTDVKKIIEVYGS